MDLKLYPLIILVVINSIDSSIEILSIGVAVEAHDFQ